MKLTNKTKLTHDLTSFNHFISSLEEDARVDINKTVYAENGDILAVYIPPKVQYL